MSALTIWQGLEEIYRGLDGLKAVILGDPPTIQESPCLIVAYGSFNHPLKNNPPARNLVGFEHLFALRLAIKWQDNPSAEMQLITLIDQIALVVDADPRLGNRLVGGVAFVRTAATGFATYGKEQFRVVDYDAVIVEKREGT